VLYNRRRKLLNFKKQEGVGNMQINAINTLGINFGARNVTLKEKELGPQKYKTELFNAGFMRQAGVSIPVYKCVPGSAETAVHQVQYQIKGDRASSTKNPIEDEHIENMLVNFYRMDAAGYQHRNLSLDHVLLSDDGKIEIDSARDAYKYSLSKGTLTSPRPQQSGLEFAIPSNAVSFERNGLSEYVTDIKDDRKKRAFINLYLKGRSLYNDARVKLLTSEKCGLSPKSDAVLYEKAQADAFRNPSDETIDYFIKKLELEQKEYDAALMWHEGSGYFGEQNPFKRFNSIIANIECLRQAMMLRDRAVLLSNEGPDEARDYFKYEIAPLNATVEEIYDQTNMGALDNFHCKDFGNGMGLYLGCRADEALYKEFYSQIDPKKSFFENSEAIDTVTTYYKNLIKDWTPNKNKTYRQDFSLPRGAA